jgi:hypothetical protein
VWRRPFRLAPARRRPADSRGLAAEPAPNPSMEMDALTLTLHMDRAPIVKDCPTPAQQPRHVRTTLLTWAGVGQSLTKDNP